MHYFTTLLLVTIYLLSPVYSFATVKVVAEVNKDIITSLDVEKQLAISTSLLPDKNINNNSSLYNQALQTLIDITLLTQEGQKLNLKITKEELNEAEQQFLKFNNITNSSLLEYCNQYNLDYDIMAKNIKSKIIWNKIVLKELAPLITVSQDEIQDSQNQLGRISPLDNIISIQEILIPFTENNNINIENEIKSLINNLNNKSNNHVEIKDYFNKYKPYINKVTLNASSISYNIQETIANSEVGKFIGPLQIAEGYLVIRILDKVTLNNFPANSLVQIKQIHLKNSVNDSFEDKITKLKQSKPSCNNLEKLSSDFNLPKPLELEEELKNLDYNLQIKLQNMKIGTVDVIKNKDSIKIIMLCKAKKVSSENENEDLLRQKIYAQKLSIQSKILWDNLHSQALVAINKN